MMIFGFLARCRHIHPIALALGLLAPQTALADLTPRAALTYLVLGNLVTPNHDFRFDIVSMDADEIVLGNLYYAAVSDDGVRLEMTSTNPTTRAYLRAEPDGAVLLEFDDMDVTLAAIDPETGAVVGGGQGQRHGLYLRFVRNGARYRVEMGNGHDALTSDYTRLVDGVLTQKKSTLTVDNAVAWVEIALFPPRITAFGGVTEVFALTNETFLDGQPGAYSGVAMRDYQFGNDAAPYAINLIGYDGNQKRLSHATLSRYDEYEGDGQTGEYGRTYAENIDYTDTPDADQTRNVVFTCENFTLLDRRFDQPTHDIRLDRLDLLFSAPNEATISGTPTWFDYRAQGLTVSRLSQYEASPELRFLLQGPIDIHVVATGHPIAIPEVVEVTQFQLGMPHKWFNVDLTLDMQVHDIDIAYEGSFSRLDGKWMGSGTALTTNLFSHAAEIAAIDVNHAVPGRFAELLLIQQAGATDPDATAQHTEIDVLPSGDVLANGRWVEYPEPEPDPAPEPELTAPQPED